MHPMPRCRYKKRVAVADGRIVWEGRTIDSVYLLGGGWTAEASGRVLLPVVQVESR